MLNVERFLWFEASVQALLIFIEAPFQKPYTYMFYKFLKFKNTTYFEGHVAVKRVYE